MDISYWRPDRISVTATVVAYVLILAATFFIPALSILVLGPMMVLFFLQQILPFIQLVDSHNSVFPTDGGTLFFALCTLIYLYILITIIVRSVQDAKRIRWRYVWTMYALTLIILLPGLVVLSGAVGHTGSEWVSAVFVLAWPVLALYLRKVQTSS